MNDPALNVHGLLQRLIDALQAVVLVGQSFERKDRHCESCEAMRASARRALEAAAHFRDAIGREQRDRSR